MSVVVWEWQEWPVWLPYSSEVTHFLESCFKSGQTIVRLDQADPSLSCYEVDLKSMSQTRQETGMARQIRRTLYPPSYPCASGISWYWFDDVNWKSYDIETTALIEKHYNSKPPGKIDLEATTLGIPNVIDLPNMLQINKHTKFQRRIQRKVNSAFKYPLDTGAVSPYASNNAMTLSTHPPSTHGFSPTKAKSNNIQTPAATNKDQDKVRNAKKKFKVGSSHGADPLSVYCKEKPKECAADEECAICFEKLKDLSGFLDNNAASSTGQDVRELLKCPHQYHGTCLTELIKSGSKDGWLQCPTCKVIQGVRQGIQPKDGTMTVSQQQQSLPGYPGCGMVVITYNFRSGKQGSEHPHPGKHYHTSGFPRVCYLPDNDKGQKVLRLLKMAWDRRLIFTIGVSNTTGQDDTVVWNEIHHKTESFSNVSGHGYPDPNYLDNVLAELASQGVDGDQ